MPATCVKLAVHEFEFVISREMCVARSARMFQAGCYRRQKTLLACECLYRLSSFVFVSLLSLIHTIFPNKYSLCKPY